MAKDLSKNTNTAIQDDDSDFDDLLDGKVAYSGLSLPRSVTDPRNI